MSVPIVDVVEFTDPACPFAWSAEPVRFRMKWRYGDALDRTTCMVVLSRSVQENLDKGMTTEMLAGGATMLAERFGMPLDTSERPRLAASLPACLAVVAARLHAPEAEDALLRALRVRALAHGGLLDDPELIAAAARDAGLDPAELAAWCSEEDVVAALEADAARARNPAPAALALDGKLAGPEGERRYTCPSYELDGASIAIPGFWPAEVYDVAMANALPDVTPRENPEDVMDVLRWAGEPLATQEVATVCGLSRDEARAKLEAAGASEEKAGTDAFWTT